MITIVRIHLTDRQRRALARYYGQRGLATRKDIDAAVLAQWHSFLEIVEDEQGDA